MRRLTGWLAIATFSAACGGGGSSPTAPTSSSTSQNTSTTTTAATSATPPTLSAAFVASDQAVAFFAFGVTLPSGAANPTYEVETRDQTAAVFAATAGTIVNVETTSQGDRAITILPASNSVWSVIHDHVNNITVSRGQAVTAGMQLGTVGALGNGRGRTELQVNRFDPTPTLAYCPRDYGTAAFNEAMTAIAQRSNGNTTVCTAATVRP
jgi:biotin carboxyl carrier protein